MPIYVKKNSGMEEIGAQYDHSIYIVSGNTPSTRFLEPIATAHRVIMSSNGNKLIDLVYCSHYSIYCVSDENNATHSYYCNTCGAYLGSSDCDFSLDGGICSECGQMC